MKTSCKLTEQIEKISSLATPKDQRNLAGFKLFQYFKALSNK